MAAYEITARLHLENIITESREVAQVLNEFADKLEQIEKKYADVDGMKSCHSCLYEDVFDTDKKPCKYCCDLSLYTKKEQDDGNDN